MTAQLPPTPPDPIYDVREEPVFEEEPDIEEVGAYSDGAHRWFVFLMGLVVILVTGFIIRDQVFTIRKVKVIGNQRIGIQAIASAAGLEKAPNYFNVDKEKIAEGINRHPYLIFEKLEKEPPATLVITVRERTPAALIQYIGVGYIMAEDGMILEKTKRIDQYANLTLVTGLVLNDIMEGSVPVFSRGEQIEALTKLLTALRTEGILNQVAQANLMRPDSILLTTADGYTVHIGDSQYLKAKIRTALAVISELKLRGLFKGIIEVTIPGEATYRPEGQ